jgi:hypothetical protein
LRTQSTLLRRKVTLKMHTLFLLKNINVFKVLETKVPLACPAFFCGRGFRGSWGCELHHSVEHLLGLSVVLLVPLRCTVGYYFPSLSPSAGELFSAFIEAEMGAKMGAKILANVSRRLEQRLRIVSFYCCFFLLSLTRKRTFFKQTQIK